MLSKLRVKETVHIVSNENKCVCFSVRCSVVEAAAFKCSGTFLQNETRFIVCFIQTQTVCPVSCKEDTSKPLLVLRSRCVWRTSYICWHCAAPSGVTAFLSDYLSFMNHPAAGQGAKRLISQLYGSSSFYPGSRQRVTVVVLVKRVSSQVVLLCVASRIPSDCKCRL